MCTSQYTFTHTQHMCTQHTHTLDEVQELSQSIHHNLLIGMRSRAAPLPQAQQQQRFTLFPKVQCTPPPLYTCTPPPLHTCTPPLQTFTPPLQTFTPPLQTFTPPPLHTCTPPPLHTCTPPLQTFIPPPLHIQPLTVHVFYHHGNPHGSLSTCIHV